MTLTKLKILSLVAGIIAIIAISAAVRSHITLSRLETLAQTATAAATKAEKNAAEIEKRNYEYKQQILSLEKRVETLRQDAAAQDSDLERLANDTNSARHALREQRNGSNKK